MILKILHSCRKNFSCKDFHFDSKGIGIPPLLNNFNSSIRLKKISQTSAISFTTPSAYRTVKRGQLFFLSTPSACKNFQSSTISFQEKYPTFTRMYSIGFRYGQQFGHPFIPRGTSVETQPTALRNRMKWSRSISAEEHILFIFSDVQRNKGNEGVEDRWNNVEFVRFRLFSKNF